MRFAANAVRLRLHTLAEAKQPGENAEIRKRDPASATFRDHATRPATVVGAHHIALGARPCGRQPLVEGDHGGVTAKARIRERAQADDAFLER
jgi:hypothetical protein